MAVIIVMLVAISLVLSSSAVQTRLAKMITNKVNEKYGTTIPVVEFDGEVRFQGKVDERLLRRLIEGTPVMQ